MVWITCVLTIALLTVFDFVLPPELKFADRITLACFEYEIGLGLYTFALDNNKIISFNTPMISVHVFTLTSHRVTAAVCLIQRTVHFWLKS